MNPLMVGLGGSNEPAGDDLEGSNEPAMSEQVCLSCNTAVVSAARKNYVLTTFHGQHMPHYAKLCHFGLFYVPFENVKR